MDDDSTAAKMQPLDQQQSFPYTSIKT